MKESDVSGKRSKKARGSSRRGGGKTITWEDELESGQLNQSDFDAQSGGGGQSKRSKKKKRRGTSTASPAWTYAKILLGLIMATSLYRTYRAYRLTQWNSIHFEPGGSMMISISKGIKSSCGALQLRCSSKWSVALQPSTSRVNPTTVPPCAAAPISDAGFYSLETETSVFFRQYQLTAGSMWSYTIRPEPDSGTSILVLRLKQNDFDKWKTNPRRLLEKALSKKRIGAASDKPVNDLWLVNTEGRYVLAFVRVKGPRGDKERVARGAYSSTLKRSSYCPPNVLHMVEEASTGVDLEETDEKVAECKSNGEVTQWLDIPAYYKSLVFTATDYDTTEAMRDAGLVRNGDRTMEDAWRCRGF